LIVQSRFAASLPLFPTDSAVGFGRSPPFTFSAATFVASSVGTATRVLLASASVDKSATFRRTAEMLDTTDEFASDGSSSASGLVFAVLGAVAVFLALLALGGLLIWRRTRTVAPLDEKNEMGEGMTWDGDFDCLFTATATFNSAVLASHFSEILTADRDEEPFSQFE
jgi:hypothetical protein